MAAKFSTDAGELTGLARVVFGLVHFVAARGAGTIERETGGDAMTLMADPVPRLMTTEELLAMPDDGVERWLVRGQLREGGVTRRNYRHSSRNADIVVVLGAWKKANPAMGGRIVCGEAGFRLNDDPDSTCGIDVAYISRALDERTPQDAFLIEGAPTLAVEILSPSDEQDDIHEKIDLYISAGVALIWIVEPVHQTITVYRPDAKPKLFAIGDEITAEPHLPGFRCAVAELFGVSA